MAQEWTDGRLDDLNVKVDRGFENADAEFRALRLELRTEFTELRGEMKAGFARIDERSDSLHHILVMGIVVMTGSMLAGFSAMLVLIATQL